LRHITEDVFEDAITADEDVTAIIRDNDTNED